MGAGAKDSGPTEPRLWHIPVSISAPQPFPAQPAAGVSAALPARPEAGAA